MPHAVIKINTNNGWWSILSNYINYGLAYGTTTKTVDKTSTKTSNTVNGILVKNYFLHGLEIEKANNVNI